MFFLRALNRRSDIGIYLTRASSVVNRAFCERRLSNPWVINENHKSSWRYLFALLTEYHVDVWITRHNNPAKIMFLFTGARKLDEKSHLNIIQYACHFLRTVRFESYRMLQRWTYGILNTFALLRDRVFGTQSLLRYWRPPLYSRMRTRKADFPTSYLFCILVTYGRA